jgi:purine-binding chemotaxis protein CheW
MNALVSSPPARAAVASPPPSAEPTQYLTFLLGGEMFALGILAIKEIIEYRDVTAVPMMPAAVRGVINLRGAVVPVVDLLARLGKGTGAVGKRTCIVIVEVAAAQQTLVVGVMVDAVSEVIDIAPDAIEPAPAFGSHIRSDFIAGIGKVRGKFVILVATHHLFTFDQVASLAESAGEAPPAASA